MADRLCDGFCDGCIYRGLLHGEFPWCKYLWKTGSRRPCPPGKGCTVKKTMKQVLAEKREQKRAEALRTVVCVICGKEFQTTDGKRKHCSAECLTEARRRAARAYNERKKKSLEACG